MQERATATFTAMIVDDEQLAQDELAYLIKAIPDIEPNRVLHIAAIRKDDDIARLEHNDSVGRPFIGEGVDMSGAPIQLMWQGGCGRNVRCRRSWAHCRG